MVCCLLQIRRLHLPERPLVPTTALQRRLLDIVQRCDPSEPCSSRLHWLHSRFENIITAVILANVVVLAWSTHDMSWTQAVVLETLNAAFLVLYLVEMALKMGALGTARYWGHFSTAFEGCLVCISLVLLMLSLTAPGVHLLAEVSGAFHDTCEGCQARSVPCAGVSLRPRILSASVANLLLSGVIMVLWTMHVCVCVCVQADRVFRVCRTLRLLRRFPQLRTLFETFISAIPAMLNVTALMVLILFIAAVVAVDMFGSVRVLVAVAGRTVNVCGSK